jgi:hypothetical protein
VSRHFRAAGMADYLELMTTDSVLDIPIYVLVERLGGAVSEAWVNAVR